jgi:hypothetical protein
MRDLRHKPFSVKDVARIYSHDERDRAGIKQLQRFAAEKGRFDIADALQRSLKHSDRVDHLTRITGRLKTTPLIGQLAGLGLTNLLIRHSIP